jgi:hypothetical protein
MLDKAAFGDKHKESAEAILQLAEQYRAGFLKTFKALDDEIQRERASGSS